LQPGSRTKKQLDQLHYTDAFVSDMNLYTSMSSVVAKESEVVSNLSSLNLLSRDIVALYANPFRRPIRAGSIGFLKMNPNWVAAKYITTSPGFPYAYFSEVDGNYHTRFAFALRDNEFISEEFWLNKNSRRDADLKMLFARAMDSKSSGSSLAEDEPEKVMAWLFRSEWEHLLVGVTTFSPDSYIALFFDLVPYVVFIYSLIIALVISALLAGLLLPPIDAVGQGVRAVEAGEDLTLRVQLANNDEFDRMGEAFNEMTAGLLQKRHISRFVSDRLLSEIASTCNLSETREERATVLASDLRNFTGISEKFPPEMVVEVLNDYFTEMEQAIKTENGSIDKFIGDAIIAVFYRQHGEKTELRAVRAALAMRHRLAGFNQRQLALGRFAIENGVGLATGSVVSTVLGSLGRRREFVITGAPLEDAERLEALSKLGRHSRIIVDAATLAALKPYCSFEQLSAEPALHEIVEMKP
jgi:class 3 adenylate cyclase